MIYLRLFWEFMQIGLFAVGGSMAAIPFLQRLGEKTGWFSQDLITDMIAISESTPGPININMATYVGYHVAGIWGGITATLAEVIPALMIVTLISKSLDRFRDSHLIGDAFYGLRPAVCGLIVAAGTGIIKVVLLHTDVYALTGRITDLIDLKRVVYFILVFVGIRKFRKHPIVYIAVSAVVGILFAF